MRIAYFDCFSGISGDMILGALMDAGLSLHQLKKQLAALPLSGYQVKVQKVTRCGLAGTQVRVILKDKIPLSLPKMYALIKRSRLDNTIKEKARTVLHQLERAERQVHASRRNPIHLHELGSPDTLIDIVGAASGLAILGIDKIYVSPIPFNYGMIESVHGPIPLPAPATIELLKGFQLYPSPIKKELVTPTGAALVSVLGKPVQEMPVMSVSAVGYGAGSWDLTEHPNLLRMIIGEPSTPATSASETVWCIETNIDNTSPEIMGYLLERLRSEGALDASVIPVQMKKSRPGFLLQVIGRAEDLMKLETIIFSESTTIGIRHYPVFRVVLNRKTVTVKTRYGKVKVKIAYQGNEIKSIAPEYEDCRSLAQAKGVSLKTVYDEVLRQTKIR